MSLKSRLAEAAIGSGTMPLQTVYTKNPGDTAIYQSALDWEDIC